MLSLNSPKPLSCFLHNHTHTFSPFLNLHPPLLLNLRTSKPSLKPISATITPSNPPSSSSNPQVYQPFRPPPSTLPPQFRSLDPQRRLEILSDRLGLWFEYAPLISSLIQQGFTPSSIEEATGISGVEQNRIVVATQVRDSLVQSQLDPDAIAYFDAGGAELLYEIRLLNNTQRASAARYIVQNRFDGQATQELSRAMKDFPRRRYEDGWESFSYTIPGDCLSFMYFRQSKEHGNPSDQRTSALERALEVAETEKAKERILFELKGKSDSGLHEEGEIVVAAKVPVVRMRIGEAAEATSVVVLPVCEGEEGLKGVVEAPECRSEGEFGVVVAERGWKRWVVLPGWEPVVGLERGVVVAFGDARVLPWKVNRWYKEEPILVVADRGKKEVVAIDGFYLVLASKQGDSGFKVERGSRLKELGVEECLGTVVLVVRPPKEMDDDQLSEEDWE